VTQVIFSKSAPTDIGHRRRRRVCVRYIARSTASHGDSMS